MKIDHEIVPTVILSLLIIQEGQLSVLAKICALVAQLDGRWTGDQEIADLTPIRSAMFLWRNKKNIVWIPLLSGAMILNKHLESYVGWG